MKVKAIVYGKEGCTLCENRVQNLKSFQKTFEKKTGKTLETEITYHDIKTVDGLTALCLDERTNCDIPIVILTDESGKLIHKFEGPSQPISSKRLMEIFG